MAADSNKHPRDKAPICPDCHGRGWKDTLCDIPSQTQTCGKCNGAGVNQIGEECDICRGTGRMDNRTSAKAPCPTCMGAGVFPVPPGLELKYYAWRPGKH